MTNTQKAKTGFSRFTTIVLTTSLLSTMVALPAYAEDFSSANFILRDSGITEGGENNMSSATFQGIGAMGQNFLNDVSSSTSFNLQPGIMNITTTPTTTTATVDRGAISSSGGGGGSDSPSSTSKKATSVKFTGNAYPKGKIIVLKDGKIEGSFTSTDSGDFTIEISNLSQTTYNFVLYAEDNKGNKSTNLSKQISAIKEKTILVQNIIFEPTIALNKTEVKKGDYINISGQTQPETLVTIIIGNNEIITTQNANKEGFYSYNLDTGVLNNGAYATQVKVGENLFSTSLRFTVGEKNVLSSTTKNLTGDINGDATINLVDFSIMAYWYGKDLPEKLKSLDLNGDSKIDLVDFSVLAANWTG